MTPSTASDSVSLPYTVLPGSQNVLVRSPGRITGIRTHARCGRRPTRPAQPLADGSYVLLLHVLAHDSADALGHGRSTCIRIMTGNLVEAVGHPIAPGTVDFHTLLCCTHLLSLSTL